MSLSPDTAIRDTDWVQSRYLSGLDRLGIETLADLVQHYPRRHEDRRQFPQFPDAETSQPVCLCGIVQTIAVKRYGGYRRACEVLVEDAGAGILRPTITCRWFNAPYVQRPIAKADRLVIFGRTKLKGRKFVMDHPEFEVVDEDEEESVHFRRIVPIHPAGEGVSPRVLRKLVWQALNEMALDALPRLIPEPFDSRSMNRAEAIRRIHFPDEFDELEPARRCLALEEFFAMQIIVRSRKARSDQRTGVVRKADGSLTRIFLESLPFEPTGAQQRCISEISNDLESLHVMHRLLQGDVGAGKTLVAAAAMLQVVESGAQAALMAPTQILAEQHYLNFQRWLKPLGLRLALRTANRKEEDSSPLFDGVGEPQIVVGTHALLFETGAFENLGLAVVDEQHKFGVLQRSQLVAQGSAVDLLVMTATPIPRTLAQTIYGDLDVSILDELPANRGKIITGVREATKLPEAGKFLRDQLDAGRQAYIVYPLVEESDKMVAKAATEEFERWAKLLEPHPCGLLHGRLRADDKERIMREFRDGKIAALIATTVVEVGVDVPNANIMLIENAERFGLAQLHQLRGRIGRGSHKSYCILLTAKPTPEARQKLDALEQTTDGFKIAEVDLELRGPGDILGTAQSGLPPLRLGNALRDTDLMQSAREIAEKILRQDPHLRNHETLRKLVQRFEPKSAIVSA